MDTLYFNTTEVEDLLVELGLHRDPEIKDGRYFNGHLFEDKTQGWALVWIGRIPDEVTIVEDEGGVEREEIVSWQPGEFFNIYLKGQPNMDRFTNLGKATLLKPETPNSKIF